MDYPGDSQFKHGSLPNIMPAIPPREVNIIECHSSLSFMKMMANEETPIPENETS
jgi:hypothetical protein